MHVNCITDPNVKEYLQGFRESAKHSAGMQFLYCEDVINHYNSCVLRGSQEDIPSSPLVVNQFDEPVDSPTASQEEDRQIRGLREDIIARAGIHWC